MRIRLSSIRSTIKKKIRRGETLSESQVKLEYLRGELSTFEPEVFVDLGSGEDAFAANSVSDLVKQGICVDIINSVQLEYENLSYVKSADGFSIPLGNESVDALWASHVLEHVCNLGSFLTEIRRVLKPGGLFMVAVPPFKYEIVNHFTTGWSPGQLAYVMAGFGFDCSRHEFYQKGYNVFGSGVKKRLLSTNTTHFGYNGISIQSALDYLPRRIKEELRRYETTSSEVLRFDGRLAHPPTRGDAR